MIAGNVWDREGTLRLVVQGPEGEPEIETQAVLDTGFDRFLTLPSAIVTALGLVRRRSTRVILADGSERSTSVYVATVIWDGTPRRVPVEVAETVPLVGMALLEGSLLRMECVEGGTLEVRALP